ncbi:MAG TPA: hypothetical protein DIW17_17170 [Clostridiales bacterium]|nr:hypothetical protein [Clostridiales bacterium]
MLKRKSICILALMLILSMVFTACTDNEVADSGNTPTKEPSKTGSEATEPPAAAEPDKIRVFYVTAGAEIPEDYDFADNPILNELAKLANVEITEAVVPPWSDVVTKYNLMMSGGNICDVVHYNDPTSMVNDGKNGAYVELTDMINQSPVLTERYSTYMEQLKADDGNIYAVRSLPVDGDVNDAFFTRYDVLQDLGYTEIPSTLDEWIDAMRKLKEKYPDAIPYTSMDNLHYCEFVFNAYGITGRGNGWQMYFGDIIHNFENPMYKEAIETYKLMLEEGLMDPEFVTSKRQDFDDKRYNKKVLVNQQNAAVCMVFAGRFMDNGIAEARPVVCQWPIVDDPRVDSNAVYEGSLPLGNHGVAIASTSKEKEASLRFIEALLSEEAEILTTWGIEGEDYTVENGQKVPDPDKKTVKMVYNMLFGYNSRASIEGLFENNLGKIKSVDGASDEELDAYRKLCWNQFDKVYADAQSVPMRPIKFITLEPDTASRAIEAQNEALTIAIRAMRGDISMEDFEVQASAFLEKYKFITDEYNEKLPAARVKAGLTD